MKRNVIVFILAVLLLASLAAPTSAVDERVIVVLNGVTLSPSPAPFIRNDRTMIPLRFIAEAMGYDVEWVSGATSLITVTDAARGVTVIASVTGDAFTLSRKVGDDVREIVMDVSPFIEDGRTFVPLRFFAEAFDYVVGWDAATATVTLTGYPTLETARPDTQFSLLGDRLTVRLPHSAAVRDDIAPDKNFAVGATVLDFNLSTEPFYVGASETFAYSSGDLTKDARLMIDSSLGGALSDYAISMPVNVASEVEYVTITPTYTRHDGDFVLLTSALARMPDKTLVFVGVYADYAAARGDENYARLAGEVVATLKPGAKLTLETRARAVPLSDYSLDVPAGYAAARFASNIFTSYALNKLVTIGESSPQLSISLGAQPVVDDDTEVKPTGFVEDTILGQTVTWSLFQRDVGAFDGGTLATAFVPIGDDGQGVNLAAAPQSEADWNVIRGIARSLKLK
ncbi:MAG: copper amine oxidase N-terminal domain-containing protein [Oscillospiraceae bacterium]|jgi:hypothetical protein|nr:copper amine oxidase N-terminal domain-containing protein [Oscillospiraceae bacterium]